MSHFSLGMNYLEIHKNGIHKLDQKGLKDDVTFMWTGQAVSGVSARTEMCVEAVSH